MGRHSLTYSHTLHLLSTLLRHVHVTLGVTECVYKLVVSVRDVCLEDYLTEDGGEGERKVTLCS